MARPKIDPYRGAEEKIARAAVAARKVERDGQQPVKTKTMDYFGFDFDDYGRPQKMDYLDAQGFSMDPNVDYLEAEGMEIDPNTQFLNSKGITIDPSMDYLDSEGMTIEVNPEDLEEPPDNNLYASMPTPPPTMPMRKGGAKKAKPEFWEQHAVVMNKNAPLGTHPTMGVVPAAMLSKSLGYDIGTDAKGNPISGIDMLSMSDEDKLRLWDMLSPQDQNRLKEAWLLQYEEQMASADDDLKDISEKISGSVHKKA